MQVEDETGAPGASAVPGFDDYVALSGGPGTYAAQTRRFGMTGMFGGQAVALGVRAALAEIDDTWRPESVHAHFVHPGLGGQALALQCRVIRRGSRAALVDVTAVQNGRTVVECIVGLARPDESAEQGAEVSGTAVPAAVPGADSELTSLFLTRWNFTALEFRHEKRADPEGSPMHPLWVRSPVPLPDVASVHWAGLAFVSDLGLVLAAPRRQDRKTAHPLSTDHTVHFLAPARLDQWLLLEADVQWRSPTRALVHATLRTEAGTLVASMLQGVTVRHPR